MDDTPTSEVSKSEPAKNGLSTRIDDTAPRSVFAALFAHWKVWLPGAGAMSLIAHFWRIGYAPSLSFGDLGTVLGAMVLFSLVAIVSVVVLLILPSAIIAYWVSQNLLPPPPKDMSIKRESRRKGLRSYWRSYVDEKPSSSRMFSVGSQSWFTAAALWTCGLYAAILFGGAWIEWPYVSKTITILFGVSGASVALIFLLLETRWIRRRLSKLRNHAIQFFLISLIYLAFWPVLLTLLGVMQTKFSGARGFYLAISLLFVPLLHFIWHATDRHKRLTTERKIAKLMPIFMFVVYSVLPLSIIDRALDIFGLGMMRNVDVVLTARGCEIVHAAWPERVCAPDHRGAADAYRLENVEVLTRIGEHYFVAAPGALDDETLPRFPIPADEVLSWRRHPPRKSVGESSK